MNKPPIRSIRGFSLIEVMLAVVVLSFGLLALAALQGALFRSGAETKARAGATALAQQVIEDARSFAYAAPPTGYTGHTYTAVGPGSWEVTGSGGVTYTVNRTVTRYRHNGTGFVADAVTAFQPSVPEFKLMSVSVGWTAGDGSAKTIQVKDMISSVSPADSINVIKTPFASEQGPQVWIEPPNKDNPAVVPIAVGDDTSAASSNPVPRRFTKVDSNTAATLFSVLTFTGKTDGPEVLLNRKLDVAGVTCRCSTGTGDKYKSTPTNPAYQPTVWNGKQLAYMEPQPLPAGTKIGLFEDKGQSARDIEAMCDTCCRDHHESSTREQRPDPHRLLTEASGAEHYLFSNLTTSISEGVYSEACQLVRVGGTMRIAVDPKQNFLLTVPLNDAKTGHEPSNFVDRYSAMVVQYLRDAAAALPTGYLSPGAPFPAFDENRYACRGTGDISCDPGYADILDPAPKYLAANAAKQLVSFGLYVDYISPDTRTAYECATTKSASSQCDGLRDRNALETLPFYAINVANLGVWSVDTRGQEWLTVTSPAFANNTGILSGEGGIVKADQNKVSSSPNNCGFVHLDITKSSSGIAGRLPIDPDDATNANKARDTLAFTSSEATTTCK